MPQLPLPIALVEECELPEESLPISPSTSMSELLSELGAMSSLSSVEDASEVVDDN